MAMVLSPTYRNLTAVHNEDRAGKIFLNLADALVGSGRWKWKYQGDSLNMFSTSNARAFTSHGGKGYVDNGGSWSTSLGGANSFSNTSAYYLLAELDTLGSATGREMLVKRHTGNTASVVNLMSISFAWEPFGGTPSATVAPTLPTKGKTFSTTDIMQGMTVANYYIAASGTVSYSIWVPDDSTGTTGDVAPFALIVYDATVAGNDLGTSLFYEALKSAASTDDHPCVFSFGTWLQLWGENTSTAVSNLGATGQQMYSVNSAGSVIATGFAPLTLPNATTTNSSTTVDITDSDGDVPILPALCFLDDTRSVYKGVAEHITHHAPPSTSYIFPHTAFADMVDASESPRLIMGRLTLPWEVGLDPSSNTSSVDRTDMYTVFPDAPVPDTTAPTISNITPAPGSALADDDLVEFDVTDVGGLGYFAVLARYLDLRDYDVVYDGTDFAPRYAGSSVEAISDGYHFSVTRDVARIGGWTGSGRVRFVAVAIDAAGNVEGV